MITLYFFVYSFIGWIYESTICSFLKYRRFVNRGFLNGPYCPIYGVGAVVGISLYKDMGHLEIFILSMITSTILEYITGYVLEKTFKRKWWDYSKQPLNLHGYICLMATVVFGIANVALITLVHPNIVLYFESFNGNLSILVIGLITVIFLDTIHSVQTHFSLIETYKLSHDYFKEKKNHMRNAISALIR